MIAERERQNGEQQDKKDKGKGRWSIKIKFGGERGKDEEKRKSEYGRKK